MKLLITMKVAIAIKSRKAVEPHRYNCTDRHNPITYVNYILLKKNCYLADAKKILYSIVLYKAKEVIRALI